MFDPFTRAATKGQAINDRCRQRAFWARIGGHALLLLVTRFRMCPVIINPGRFSLHLPYGIRTRRVEVYLTTRNGGVAPTEHRLELWGSKSRVGAEQVIHSADVRYYWTVVVRHDRQPWLFDCCI
jgi:hypothetical protein